MSLVTRKHEQQAQLTCIPSRLARFLSPGAASSSRCLMALKFPFRQDDGRLYSSFPFPEWHLDILIDVIRRALEVAACALQQH